MPSKKRTASPAPAPNASKSQDALYAKLFDQLDTDHSGYLDFDELYAALVSHYNAPKHITPQVVMNMMDEADIDGNGLIDLKEFISIMKNARDSKYWKTTSDSLWGSFRTAVRNAADITEHILQPVYQAVAMHAHPHIKDGKLEQMCPSIAVRLFAGFVSILCWFFWPFVPCFAWPKGKTLGAFLFGFHYRSEKNRHQKASFGELFWLFGVTALASIVAPHAIAFVFGLIAKTSAPLPHASTLGTDPDYSVKYSQALAEHQDVELLQRKIVIALSALLLIVNAISFLFSSRTQTIFERWAGLYCAVDGGQ